MKFEEKAIFRNLIGKLLLNGSEILEDNQILKENFQSKNEINVLNLMDASKKHEKLTLYDNNMSRSQLMDVIKTIDNTSFTKSKDKTIEAKAKDILEDTGFGSFSDKTSRNLKQEFSRSFSLNDLISAANELISQQAENDLAKSKNYAPKSQQNLNKLKECIENNSGESVFFQKNCKGEANNSKDSAFLSNKGEKHHKDMEKNELSKNKFLSNSSKQILQTTNLSYYPSPMAKRNFILPNKVSPLQQHPKLNIPSILKNSSNHQLSNKSYSGSGVNLAIEKEKLEKAKPKIPNEQLNNLVEQYRLKLSPKQRLEIDILPSHLSCCKNKLLIASSFGKIRGSHFLGYVFILRCFTSILIIAKYH